MQRAPFAEAREGAGRTTHFIRGGATFAVLAILCERESLSRISLAFKSFFAILFQDRLPAEVANHYEFFEKTEIKPPKPVVEVRTSDGALQILGILQRDARLVDFLMEDISSYEDEQVGAAVRSMHDQCRDALDRYVSLSPIIDGVEGTVTRIESRDPNRIKLLGNVPADGKAQKGILRHRGWRAEKVELPKLASSQDMAVIAPAEIEIE